MSVIYLKVVQQKIHMAKCQQLLTPKSVVLNPGTHINITWGAFKILSVLTVYPQQIKSESPGVGPRHKYFFQRSPADSNMLPKLRISCLNGGLMGVCCISTFMDI